jgi:predicted MPP superfamily phosphohydrolase
MSDLHAGLGHTNPARVREAAELLNAQEPRPDLPTGRLPGLDALRQGQGGSGEIASELARLRAPLGTLRRPGNHDWRAAGAAMGDALNKTGLTVLENAAAQAGELWVAGVADMRTRLPDIPKALERVPEDAPVLLLAHDPDLFPQVPPRVALTLAGHTHGGQVDRAGPATASSSLGARRALPRRAGGGGGPPAVRLDGGGDGRPATAFSPAARGRDPYSEIVSDPAHSSSSAACDSVRPSPGSVLMSRVGPERAAAH